MTPNEYTKWETHMKSQRGKWSVDLIHDGQDGRRLLLFRLDRDSSIRGVYINIDGCHANAGTFDGAVPHMGDALYTPNWNRQFDSNNAAMTFVIERVGMPLLMGLIGCGMK